MMADTKFEYADLVLTNGKLIRLEIPEEHSDDIYEMIDNAMQVGGWWSPSAYADCDASYLGNSLDRINMSLVIGML
jgi:hypothetical protein